MKLFLSLSLLFSFAKTAFTQDIRYASEPGTGSVYDFVMTTIDGAEKPLSDYKGKVLLIVNTASKCGFTPQYKPLEELYRTYADRGFTILAFPANNFNGQEPGTDAQIKEFCTTKYDVTFDLFHKINVRGDDIHPLYAYLTGLPGVGGDITWNFNKFLVDREGHVIARFGTRIDPLNDKVVAAVEEALAEK